MVHKKQHHHVVRKGIKLKYYITLFLLLLLVAFLTFFFARWLNSSLEDIEFPLKIVDPEITSVLVNTDGVSSPKVLIRFETSTPARAKVIFSGQGYYLEIPFKETKNTFTTSIYLGNESFSKTYDVRIEVEDLSGNKDAYQATVQVVKNINPTVTIN